MVPGKTSTFTPLRLILLVCLIAAVGALRPDFLIQQAHATHFRYGHLQWSPTGATVGGGTEVVFHLELYKNKPECNAIVHLHSTYLTAISCLKGINPDNAIRACTPYYVMRIGSLPVIPYIKPGDPQIAVELGNRAKSNRAFLLANHGPIVTGTDLIDAVDNTEELEETARLALLVDGKPVRYLTDTEIADLHRS